MDKSIDEDWKESAKKEAETESAKKEEGTRTIEAGFGTFIASMAMEALIFLGEIPNPITKKKEENSMQAKYIIDTITLLKDKTKGNLTAEEANSLDNVLYELRTKFVAKDKK